jgi:4-hydroxybenzoate polyprenyltransferase
LVYYGLKLPTNTLFYFIPFGLLTVVYVVPFLGGFQKNLRRVSYLKIFLVAFVWSGVTTTIPLIVGQYQQDYSLVLLFVQRMLFILVLILPFEIRDMKLDFKNLKTLPQKIGIEKTKKVGFVLLLFSLTMEFLITTSLSNKNIYLLISFILLLFLMRSSQNQSKFYSSFWVESLPILWWILILIL